MPPRLPTCHRHYLNRLRPLHAQTLSSLVRRLCSQCPRTPGEQDFLSLPCACREESRLFEKEILLNQAEASLEARRAALQQALGWAQDEHAAPPGLPRGNDPMAVAFVEDAEAGFPGGYEAEGPASEGEDTEAGMRAAVQGGNSSLAEAEPYPRAHE